VSIIQNADFYFSGALIIYLIFAVF